MKKKLFAIILCLAILLSIAASLSEVSFAQGEKYILSEDGVPDETFTSAEDLITYMNTPGNFNQAKSYTLTLNDNLEIPVEISNLKTLEIHCNLTIEGNSNQVTGAAGGTEGDRFINIINGNINIKNLDFDGSDIYAGILSDNTDAANKPSLKISDCNFNNMKTQDESKSYDFKDLGGSAISLVNTAIEAKSVNVSNSEAYYYGGAFYIEVNKEELFTGPYLLQDCNFNKCNAKIGGGALAFRAMEGDFVDNVDNKEERVEVQGTLDLEGCTIDNCSGNEGGAMRLEGPINSTITDYRGFDNKLNSIEKQSRIINCTGDEAGAIYSQASTVSILNKTLINNCSSSKTVIVFADSNRNNGKKYNNKDLTIMDSFIQDCDGCAIYMHNGDIVLKKTSIKNCRINGRHNSAIFVNGWADIDNCTFENNGGKESINSGAIYIKDEFDRDCRLQIYNSKFIGNIGGLLGAIASDGVEFEIKNSSILNNEAASGAGICYVSNGSINNNLIQNTKISNNRAIERIRSDGSAITIFGEYKGGALYLELDANDKVIIDGGEITNNKADSLGGAIYVLENYADQELANKNSRLIINDDVKFGGNTAGYGYYNPPENYEDYENFTHKTHSRPKRIVVKDGEDYKHVDSLLNNYDINYVNKETSTVYDPNGGQGKLFYVKECDTPYDDDGFIKDHTVKIKELKDTNISNGSKVFLGWSTEPDGKGSIYKPGEEYTLKGNLYLYAIWKNPVQITVILTLDENHRGGEITNIEAEVGELIEPHLYIPRRRGYIFRGWSYDRKHLDEVKPGDRIYTDTTLYAIWKRAEEEKVEEPEEIKGEDHKAYIFGYPNGSVRPNGSITRAEAAAMLARLLNIEAIGSAAKPQFSDTESSWYNKAINAVVFRGIMKGYPDGRFRPNAPITRAEFTQMISTIDNKPYGVAPFADVPGHWAERAIGSEYQAKRITGYPDGLFRPDANITRAEAAVILNKIFERKYDNLSLLKCKNPQMIKRFTDLNESFWGWNDMVEATNTHEYVRRYKEDVLKRVEEDWLLIK